MVKQGRVGKSEVSIAVGKYRESISWGKSPADVTRQNWASKHKQDLLLRNEFDSFHDKSGLRSEQNRIAWHQAVLKMFHGLWSKCPGDSPGGSLNALFTGCTWSLSIPWIEVLSREVTAVISVSRGECLESSKDSACLLPEQNWFKTK